MQFSSVHKACTANLAFEGSACNGCSRTTAFLPLQSHPTPTSSNQTSPKHSLNLHLCATSYYPPHMLSAIPLALPDSSLKSCSYQWLMLFLLAYKQLYHSSRTDSFRLEQLLFCPMLNVMLKKLLESFLLVHHSTFRKVAAPYTTL